MTPRRLAVALLAVFLVGGPPPESAANVPGPSAEVVESRLVLRVDRLGRVRIQGRAYSRAEARAYLVRQARGGGASRMEVLILAHPDAAYAQIYQLLECARRAGYKKLEIRAAR